MGATSKNDKFLTEFHVDRVRGFIKIFSNLDEMREFMQTGIDDYGYVFPPNFIYSRIRKAYKDFKDIFHSELLKEIKANPKYSEIPYDLLMDEFENYVSKSIY